MQCLPEITRLINVLFSFQFDSNSSKAAEILFDNYRKNVLCLFLFAYRLSCWNFNSFKCVFDFMVHRRGRFYNSYFSSDRWQIFSCKKPLTNAWNQEWLSKSSSTFNSRTWNPPDLKWLVVFICCKQNGKLNEDCLMTWKISIHNIFWQHNCIIIVLKLLVSSADTLFSLFII